MEWNHLRATSLPYTTVKLAFAIYVINNLMPCGETPQATESPVSTSENVATEAVARCASDFAAAVSF